GGVWGVAPPRGVCGWGGYLVFWDYNLTIP
ncbi:hypothetical protein M2432_003883, partial [Mycobacterium sp. OTB74]|nr:hypothetical protein [Mycobacterium sp. OTB74]